MIYYPNNCAPQAQQRVNPSAPLGLAGYFVAYNGGLGQTTNPTLEQSVATMVDTLASLIIGPAGSPGMTAFLALPATTRDMLKANLLYKVNGWATAYRSATGPALTQADLDYVYRLIYASVYSLKTEIVESP